MSDELIVPNDLQDFEFEDNLINGSVSFNTSVQHIGISFELLNEWPNISNCEESQQKSRSKDEKNVMTNTSQQKVKQLVNKRSTNLIIPKTSHPPAVVNANKVQTYLTNDWEEYKPKQLNTTPEERVNHLLTNNQKIMDMSSETGETVIKMKTTNNGFTISEEGLKTNLLSRNTSLEKRLKFFILNNQKIIQMSKQFPIKRKTPNNRQNRTKMKDKSEKTIISSKQTKGKTSKLNELTAELNQFNRDNRITQTVLSDIPVISDKNNIKYFKVTNEDMKLLIGLEPKQRMEWLKNKMSENRNDLSNDITLNEPKNQTKESFGHKLNPLFGKSVEKPFLNQNSNESENSWEDIQFLYSIQLNNPVIKQNFVTSEEEIEKYRNSLKEFFKNKQKSKDSHQNQLKITSQLQKCFKNREILSNKTSTVEQPKDNTTEEVQTYMKKQWEEYKDQLSKMTTEERLNQLIVNNQKIIEMSAKDNVKSKPTIDLNQTKLSIEERKERRRLSAKEKVRLFRSKMTEEDKQLYRDKQKEQQRTRRQLMSEEERLNLYEKHRIQRREKRMRVNDEEQ